MNDNRKAWTQEVSFSIIQGRLSHSQHCLTCRRKKLAPSQQNHEGKISSRRKNWQTV
jgi:hypothetical protein